MLGRSNEIKTGTNENEANENDGTEQNRKALGQKNRKKQNKTVS